MYRYICQHLLTSEARKQRPRRGRPPRRTEGQSEGLHSSAATPKVRQLRSCRTESHRDDGVSQPVSVGPNVAVSTVCTSARVYDSSVANHLVNSVSCAQAYDDSCFTVLSRARSRYFLSILEAVYIYTRKPDLCKQQNSTIALKLFHGKQ